MKSETRKANTRTTDDDRLASYTRTLAKGGVSSFLGMGVHAASGYLYEFLLARFLGPGLFGIYVLAQSLMVMIRLVGQIGLRNALVRIIGMWLGRNDKRAATAAAGAGVRLALVIGALASVGLFVGAGFLSDVVFKEPSLKTPIRIYSLMGFAQSILVAMIAILRGFRKIGAMVMARDIMFYALSLLFLGLAIVTLPPEWRTVPTIVAVETALMLCTLAYATWHTHRLIQGLHSRKDKNSTSPMLPLLKQALPFAVIGLLMHFNTRADDLVLGYFRGSSDVGVYGLARRLPQFLSPFVQAMNLILAPMISELQAAGQLDVLAVLFRRATRWIVSLTLPLSIAAIVIAQGLLGLAGEQFAAGGPIVTILTLSGFISTATGLGGVILMMSGHEKTEMLILSISAILKLILGVLLISQWGIVGAAISQLITQGILAGLRLGAVNRILHTYPFDSDIVKPCIATLLSGGLLYLGYRVGGVAGVLIGLAIFTISYVGSMMLLGLEQGDRELLKRGLEKALATVTLPTFPRR